MAGPGGGSRGGGARGGSFGGSRGGSFGGSHGGSFGGNRGGFGPRPPIHHHHMPHVHYGGFGPRRYYNHGGGGCLGAMIAPFVFIVFAAIMFFSSLNVSYNDEFSGYNEAIFQAYADSEYNKAFGDSSGYEDNILIVFLTNEDADDYYYIAWVGDHIEREINYMFGNNETELGHALYSNVNMAGYWYSLDMNLAGAVDMMTENVLSLGLESSFTCNEGHSAKSRLINYTELSLTEETVNAVLETFTEVTGIPMCIVVEDYNDVLLKEEFSTSKTSPLLIVLIVLVVVIVIYLIVKTKKDKKDEGKDTPFEDEYKGPEIE